MEYMILIYGDEKAWNSLPEEKIQQIYADYGRYTEELSQAGVMRGGSELAPVHSATTVRLKDGKVVCTDGPFAETKEQLGGYYIIEVANIDEAIKWAAKCPSAQIGSSIEIRPLV
ncbi:MAG TPA: YciI family protein [Paucimonas sp.]|nr:YciI family protein [Paucimonas sp.]